MIKKFLLCSLLLFISINVVQSETKIYYYNYKGGDIGPIPYDYIEVMKYYNTMYFKFDRLDLVIRLFWWESRFKPLTKVKNSNGSYDCGIAAINSNNLDIKKPKNFIELFWKPTFPHVKFIWSNPYHSIFLGMAYLQDCLKSTNNMYDAIIMYNSSWVSYMGKLTTVMCSYPNYKIALATKRELNFVFKFEEWYDENIAMN
jgi:hypothetical protein